MEEIKKISVVKKYTDVSELSETDMAMLKHAKEAVHTAYAPYSKFYVGCAVLLENGEIILGSNQENIAYPSGLCAERVAIFHAGSKYPNVPITAIAITVKAHDFLVKEPIACCGACLQSMSEFEMKFKKPMRIILQGEVGDILVAEGVKVFLPFQFWVEELKK
ncbi:MAG: cytidine deaminase [Bacteroidota bacterium]